LDIRGSEDSQLSTPKLVFAHLSDIHFTHGLSDVSRLDPDRILREAILADAKVLKSELGEVHGILITGDIAYAGKATEYQIALKWLSSLADQLGCARESVWCVPGNHDVDQSLLKEISAIVALQVQLRQSPDIDEQLRRHLEDKVSGPLLFAPLKTYNEEFSTKFNCITTPAAPWWEDDFTLNDGSILRLRGLNSVLVSGLSDDNKNNKLLLGSAQTEIGRQEGVEYVVLCHHPVDWLLDGENTEEALLAYSRIQLFGHKHKQKVMQINDSVWVSAGAVHPVRKEQSWVPQYNYIAIEVQGTGAERYLSVDVYARMWSQTDRAFTHEPNTANAVSRNFRLKLNQWQGAGTAAPAQAQTATLKRGEQKMKPEREVSEKRLLYGFMSLPHHTRLSIMENFGLLQPEDLRRPDAEVFATCFKRAREKGLLDSVWTTIREYTKSQE
jgi:predicted phosphodiesterase